jgi:hypothetical protein
LIYDESTYLLIHTERRKFHTAERKNSENGKENMG